MVFRSILVTLVVAVLSLPRLVASLQVTPGSPCSSFCIDSPELDETDPESSNTESDDITCHNGEFASTPKGQKFQRCMACLQDSSFSFGQESDQQWFLYNIRYAVDYCVLGYPNATDNASGPCMTKESCGAFNEALEDGILEPAYAQPYQFCDKSDQRIDSHYMERCQTCVGLDESQSYLVNFLVAIQAGCRQKPAHGVVIGLSDSIFTTETIEITEPSSSSGASSDDGDSMDISPPIIAAIAIGSLVLMLLAAGCTYMQIRKRRNRRARQRRGSPLSFRCQTHVTPMTPNFPSQDSSREKPYVNPAEALSSNPVVMPEKVATVPMTAAPTPPQNGYASPESHFTTPTSTTSNHSNAPLLASSNNPRPPTEFPNPPSTLPGLAITTPEGSSAAYFEQQPTTASTSLWGTPGSTRDLTPKSNLQRVPPSANMRIQTTFPPPPRPKRWGGFSRDQST